MKEVQEIISLIDEAIKDDPSQLITAGDIIKDGYNSDVDEYRMIIQNSQEWLADYQRQLIELTKISNLKIKYTNVLGYFIEIPLREKEKVPDSFRHKQTLISAMRFVTDELLEFDAKMSEGENSLAQKEYELYQDVRDKILESFSSMKHLSEQTADVDFLVSFTQAAYDNNYNKPAITKGGELIIKSGRHPIIETIENDFISNDLILNDSDYIHIVTGPNMGGKSTYLRQNALIILMTHMGSFVPASEAIIPKTDKLFSRIGASDNLVLGQSTFMVEMQEIANIIHNSTPSSFVIIDEIGRGTSTYDGMSLAWAILRHLHDTVKVKTLFATHFHELIDESSSLKGVGNYSVAVGEDKGGIIFLRKIIKGGIKKSYGIEVARLAGLSDSIIKESQKMLQKLEKEHKKSGQLSIESLLETDIIEKKEVIKHDDNLSKKLGEIDINSLTPVEALVTLGELIKITDEEL